LTEEGLGFIKKAHCAAGCVHSPLRASLIRVAPRFVKVFYLDLAVADIPKQGEQGRTVGLHALCRAFGTGLSKRRGPSRSQGRHPAFVAEGHFGGTGCATARSTPP
jgi:hypothetical protein